MRQNVRGHPEVPECAQKRFKAVLGAWRWASGAARGCPEGRPLDRSTRRACPTSLEAARSGS
eukprot:1295142-Alexandrium_andersonii.AAC.1